VNLKELLKSKRWNGSSLSVAVGLNRETVYLWLRGKTEPNTETIKKIAELCEVEPSVVFNAVLKTKEEAKAGK
jgi:transcriptional regulator with XRE-family HTH domain